MHELPEGKVFLFTANGDLEDISFLNPEQNELLVSGFGIVRHSNSVHWLLVGGEMLDEREWKSLCEKQTPVDLSTITPSKRAFLSESIETNGGKYGAPIPLANTNHALKTIAAGEFMIDSMRHLSRCIMTEYENSFMVISDDPEILREIPDEKKSALIESMNSAIRRNDIIWSVAEGLLQLPTYFNDRVAITKDVIVKSGERINLKTKGGKGLGAQYKTVPAIDIVTEETNFLTPISLPHYDVETDGHWRKLKVGSVGKTKDGEPIKGKTWVNKESKWRERDKSTRTIYIKDRMVPAKEKVEELHRKAAGAEKERSSSVSTIAAHGELYVLRCTMFADNVFKVGWTSGKSEKRAQELSGATGVPTSFIVVDHWKHEDACGLETEVHAMLAPYRLNAKREFFQVSFDVIKHAIEATIKRTEKKN